MSDLATRFWSKVDIKGPNECWPWKAGRCSFGYGVIKIKGKSVNAHRVAYELTHGPLPNKLHVLHHCDNPPCCNPNCLFKGSAKENAEDKVRKERHVSPPGEGNGRSILTEKIVRHIRYNIARGVSQAYFCRKYNLSSSHVSDIVHKRIWKHL